MPSSLTFARNARHVQAVLVLGGTLMDFVRKAQVGNDIRSRQPHQLVPAAQSKHDNVHVQQYELQFTTTAAVAPRTSGRWASRCAETGTPSTESRSLKQERGLEKTSSRRGPTGRTADPVN